MKEKLKQEKGITLIALVITIIVLLILAGVSIAMLTGNNGILTQAQKAKFLTEVQEINERVELSQLDENSKFGNINNVLNIDSSYNDKLEVENGKLVYVDGKFSNTELEWLKEIGIEKKNRYYMVMSKETKNNEYKDYDNAGTIADFRNVVNDGSFSSNYDIAYLIEDIDFSEINSGELNSWTPIGTEENKFDKIFEGGKNKIENVNINSDLSNQGIFSYNSGTIRNLILESGNITATRAGGIVFMNEGSIINCANRLKINMSNNSGGIAGRNKGKIIASYNEGNVEGNGSSIGGLVGWNDGGTVDSCYNIGNIVNKASGSSGSVGGIVGANTGEVMNCFNKGSMEAYGDCIGGICGMNYNDISNCYNLGNVTTSTNSIGGIVGFSASENSISNCINSGDIKGGSEHKYIGGIIGYYNGSSIRLVNCKSNCNISGGKESVGGIAGYSGVTDTISNCMWYANSEVSFGIGSLSSNENATYVENLQLDSVLDIVNGENNFKSNGGEVVLNWQ